MSNEIARINSQLPDFMRGSDGESKHGMAQYIVPPRVKIIQPTTNDPQFDGFKQGDVILTPLNLELLKFTSKDEGYSSIACTPLFWFVEYCLCNPIGKKPFIAKRSFDHGSMIAQRARDPDRRIEPDPTDPMNSKKASKYREHINVAVLLHMEGLDTTPATITFAGAEHRAGSLWLNKMRIRDGEIYGQNYVGVLKMRSNSEGKWYGFDFGNPPADSGIFPYVQTADEYERNRSIHTELREAFNAGLLKVDDEAGAEFAGEVVSNGNGAASDEY